MAHAKATMAKAAIPEAMRALRVIISASAVILAHYSANATAADPLTECA
jgi:hypothetical protein